MPEQDQDLVVDIPTEGPSVSVTLENSPSQEIKDAKEPQEPVDPGSGDDE